MRRVIWFLLSVLFLAACGAASPSAAPEETAVSPTTAPSTADQAAATQDLTVTLEEASTVRERDWVKGATVPIVTIIEYGDFQ
ncbi:MAG: hypothetical protein H6659_00110 [Ardenticatenaceae bacterium]|mgnify:CR=1 FL=1|nr:hypothetical protein [Anaerolineales bacterium]MCB8982210.1 hypothetical protein [Ardenticatenaceae bacterium]MCB8986997.1 hypothetical protein [Ardenticatenaceae bacterium]